MRLALVTDEKGESQKIELPVGHYTIKEEIAAKEYAIETISDKDSKVTINSEETTTFKTSDKPQNDPLPSYCRRSTGRPESRMPSAEHPWKGPSSRCSTTMPSTLPHPRRRRVI